MAFDELKAQHGAMWAEGDFERVAETLADAHASIVELLDPQPGEPWLDVACGTGGVAERAARRGAEVTGVDISPALIETARRRALEHGLEIDYRLGDAERLELEDASFDVASSSFGIIFAPTHEDAAAELARVVRPGGRIAITSWTPDGAVAGFLRMLGPYQPPPPDGAGNPLAWGDPEHVRRLLGDAFELSFEQGASVYRADSPQAAWDDFAENFGPLKALVASLPPERLVELQSDWLDFFAGQTADGAVAHRREYLLVSGVRR